MGYLLKEALKTLCGVNQWAYAVFWKIGCQNPKLLIWEECYYESASCSGLPPEIALQGPSGVRVQDKVHLLVDKMMVDNHFNIVGEGLVGRTAFTGNHQWILSGNYYREEHPPEVLKDVCQQFAAGMQTIAVIPALPHGVVQFGSYLTIMENPGFVKDVTSLILGLGYVSGALLSEDFAANEHNAKIGISEGLGNSTPPGGSFVKSKVINPSFSFDSFDYVEQTSMINGQISLPCPSQQLASEVARAEVIPSNLDMWMNQHASNYVSACAADGPSQNLTQMEQKLFPDTGVLGHFDARNVSGMDSFSDVKQVVNGNVAPKHRMYKNANLTKMGGKSKICKEEMDRNTMMACDAPRPQYEHIKSGEFVPIPGFVKDEHKRKFGDHTTDDLYVQPESGDDLFDVLGADFKNKLFSHCGNGYLSNDSNPTIHYWDRNDSPSQSRASPEMYSGSRIFSSSGTDNLLEAVVTKVPPSTDDNVSCRTTLTSTAKGSPSQSRASPEMYSGSRIFSSGTDNLLEAVVTKVPPSTDDNVSCRTTLTSTAKGSAPDTVIPYGGCGVSNRTKGELFDLPKYPGKVGETSSCSLITGASMEESGTYSQGSSIYGSQISSWIQKNENAKLNNSASTGYSKKPETGKTTRRRLKPGENPRPRPKDRQMIQDRVKELREIVPNGAKCSIDSLLERTIKHMLFLQSVTKHADKLKQTGESKIISKDGGLLLKDNFDGGATWAYEVGSQSMVCPIIVEDLNQSRQMLVEMLCEERGLFLEIADIIRGLGLTILKGVMETRNDKIWARFAVEANRDITRMEIFISLVRLLEQSSKQQTAGASENHPTTAAHQCHTGSPSSIPLPGGSH